MDGERNGGRREGYVCLNCARVCKSGSEYTGHGNGTVSIHVHHMAIFTSGTTAFEYNLSSVMRKCHFSRTIQQHAHPHDLVWIPLGF